MPEGKMTTGGLHDLAERIQSGTSVRQVFGEPIEVHDRTLIPVARVGFGFGGGLGSSRESQRGLAPSYTEWHPRPEHASQPKVLVISPDGREGSATIHQDAHVYRLRLQPGQSVTHDLAPGRGAWLQIAHGALRCNEVTLETGDGASTEQPGTLTLTATHPTEALLFDLR